MRRDVPRQSFRGRELAAVSAQARAALGEDAVVLRTSTVRPGTIEIVAADSRDVERFRARMTPQPLGSSRRVTPAKAGAGSSTSRRDVDSGVRRNDNQLVVALVGPTGAGKTTTAIKLAVHGDMLGADVRVGFVTLDTYRAGAVAQLETYAQVASVPLEVVYELGDVPSALARLAHCDVIIVDTPGRSPKDGADADWRVLLAALRPDEVHLVMPATVRADVAEAVRDSMAATHLAITKLDEVPDESGVTALASRLDLPVRWVCDGQSIPADLAHGVPRLMHALGSAEVAA